MEITVNGTERTVAPDLSLDDLLRDLGLDSRKIAVERNREIVRRAEFGTLKLRSGDSIEIVHLVGGGDDDRWEVAGRRFHSRLIIGTGKFATYAQNRAALEASGAEIITVAVRRVNLDDPNAERLTDVIDPKAYTYLPNTAGCYTADDALRTLRLAREVGGWTLVKLEMLGDPDTLYPDMPETLRVTEILVREGFEVMVYCTDDPLLARRLEDLGAAAVMPLGAPIGSGLGIQNPLNIRFIVERLQIPVIVDAGVGTASDATLAMELGCDAVLMNTAIAGAEDPVRMARAMRAAVSAGRDAYLAGRIPRKFAGDPSSPVTGLIG